ncbi:MAG TPA: cysteine desulfurase [Candidatus Dormibacteraeota bacterium]|jgi:cysteine desulfurase/selenocysteine lyase|nr:cysteine desulfurase [Candidatus Dormibacteraeota bacterium]
MSAAVTTPDTAAAQPLDVARVREDFPILSRRVGDRQLVYLDSAATSQKPVRVLDAIDRYYRQSNANVHRGVHTLGNEATELFEHARARVAAFIDAPSPDGVVFLRNTTEALNLVASSYARELLQPGDRVVLTDMEHHSNLVPWQLAAERRGLELAFLHVRDDGTLDMEEVAALLQAPTKLISLAHQSNVLGTINPLREITRIAHDNGVLVCVDAAQSVPHMPVSVRDLDVDFLAFSGHKMCGPMGAGVLWARPELLERMPPFLGGGSMILRVELQRSSWNTVPHKFEAGTPDVASAAGLAAACDYLDAVGLDAIHAHEQALASHMTSMLEELGGITVYGPADVAQRGGTVSFNVADVHPHDVGTIVDREGVAIRAGHHCCQPLMHRLDVAATARASVYLYNTHDEIDALGAALQEVKRVFGV